MIKVYMNRDLLEYREMIRETLRETIRQNFVGGVRDAERGELPLISEELLPCPHNLIISLHQYEGNGEDFIGIIALHDFGIHTMDVTIYDNQGNLIERGEASPYPEDPELWQFYPTACVPAGKWVTVQIVAVDCMGGVGISREHKQIE